MNSNIYLFIKGLKKVRENRSMISYSVSDRVFIRLSETYDRLPHWSFGTDLRVFHQTWAESLGSFSFKNIKYLLKASLGTDQTRS